MIDEEALIELREMRREVAEMRRETADSRRALEAILEFLEGIVIEPFTPAEEQSEDESEFPIDFPYRDALAAAGIVSPALIPLTANRLKKIDGIDQDAIVPIFAARKALLTRRPDE